MKIQTQSPKSDVAGFLTTNRKRYIVTIIVILLSAPFLRELLYERSKDLIRALVPYRQPWITSIMQFYSVLFDGEYIVVFCGVMLSLGFAKDYIYLMICFNLNLHFLSLLKTVYHDSRPQFDEPSLAVMNEGVCAAEFGNPSGHTILAAHFFVQASLYYKESLTKRFPKVPVGFLIDFTVYFNLAAIAFCRLYLGRHTLD